MKSIVKSVLLLLIIAACSKSNPENKAAEASESLSPTKALYNKVMDIHNEVMPRMGEMERLKRELKERIAQSPDLVIEKKKQITQIISNLDSAGAAMMNWMHEFAPLPDTVSEAAQREYLEAEMERVKKVRELMTNAIREAKEVEKN